MRASGNGHVECVKILLERGAQANTQNKVSSTMSFGYLCTSGVCGL